jgi:LacI family transcriptional regulator
MTEPVNRTIQLATALRDAIRRGDFAPNQAIPSERQLCETYGVSRTTVRRALRILEEQGIAQRVPGSGTYVRSVPGMHPERKLLGLIVPTLTNPYYGELADAIEQEVTASGRYDVLLGRSNYTSQDEGNYLIRLAENRAVMGVLIVPNPENPPLEAYRFLIQSKPLVQVSRPLAEVNTDAVYSDRLEGGRRLVQHLVAQGHRQIAYVRGTPPMRDMHHEGYLLGLQEAGLQADPDLFVSLEIGHEQAGEEGTRLLLRRGRPFTAIFARNDFTAVGVLRALNTAGLKVPDDIAVVGYDNTRLSAHLQPPLTTIDNSVREMGRLAAQFLLDRIEGRFNGPTRQVIIEPELFIRASSAPNAGTSSPVVPAGELQSEHI